MTIQLAAPMHMHGGELAQLTWGRAVSSWQFAPGTTALLVLAAAGYLAGVHRLTRRHRQARWPLHRTLAFLAGLAVVAVASMGSPAVYGGGGVFWMHMVAHLLLIMIAPWLLAIGLPVTLALRSLRGRPRLLVRAAVRSRVAGVLTFPLVPLAAYTIVLIGVHLTGFMDAMMRHDSLMVLERLLYLGAGFLFFGQVLAREPARYQLTYPLRLGLLFLSMMGDTLVGVVLIQSNTPPFDTYAELAPSWGPGALTDVHNGGALMWIGGDAIMFAMMMVLVLQWVRSNVAEEDGFGRFLESARRNSLAEGAARVGLADTAGEDTDSDAALEAYNRMLSRLHSTGGGVPANREPAGSKGRSAGDAGEPG
jgi:cytochrome c oxidase assembly factor CtaG